VHWRWPVGAAPAFLLALATTPAGVSGAVLLLPIQRSVLHVPQPVGHAHQRAVQRRRDPRWAIALLARAAAAGLTGVVAAGTSPGVIVGAIVRVEVPSGQRSFQLIAALVLLPLGLWLLLGAQNLARPYTVPCFEAGRGEVGHDGRLYV